MNEQEERPKYTVMNACKKIVEHRDAIVTAVEIGAIVWDVWQIVKTEE